MQHFACKRRVSPKILEQAGQVRDNIAVEKPGGQFGLLNRIGTGLIVASEIVSGDEIVALCLLCVDREGVGHMNSCFYVRPRIRSDHPPEQRAGQPAWKFGARAQHLEIFLVLLEPIRGEFLCRILVSGCLGHERSRRFGEICDFHRTQKQCLPRLLVSPLVAVNHLQERVSNLLDDLRVGTIGPVPQDLAFDDLP